jgi:hypothetical protein
MKEYLMSKAAAVMNETVFVGTENIKGAYIKRIGFGSSEMRLVIKVIRILCSIKFILKITIATVTFINK